MKKYLLSSSCVAVIAGAALSLQAAEVSLPVVEIFGTKYYLYECRKGDTMFGIARDQSWDDSVLQRLNPDAVSPLKKGVRIYYPVNPADTAISLPKNVTAEAIKEISHVVSKGETIYDISKMYGVPVDVIYSLNPSSRNGIKPGQCIELRKSESDIATQFDGVNPEFYTIRKDDSIKTIADAYDTSVASILKLNPGVSPDRLREGSIIRIPVKGSGLQAVRESVDVPRLDAFDLHTVSDKQTWDDIARQNGVDVAVLKAANPGVDNPKKKQVVVVPRIVNVKEERIVSRRDERESTSEGIREIYEDLHNVAEATVDTVTVRIAIIAETPSAKKDVEFIRGFLAGVDRLKKQSFKIGLKIVDGSAPSADVITSLDDFKPNLVFFTGDKNIPSYVSEYASVSQTPVVNTFDVKSEDYLHNPFIIQLLTPSAYFNESVAKNAYNRFGNYTLVMIGEEDANDQLAPELKKIWDPSKIKYLPVGVVDPQSFANDGKYLFYAYTVKKPEVEKVLQEISAAKEVSPFADFAVLARPNWIMFEQSLAEPLHRVNTFIPSRFYMDEKSDVAKNFQTAYRTMFHRAPVKSLPLYAGVGYDTSTYFIQAMAESSNDINNLKPSHDTVQSDFNLKRVSNWSGFLNPPVYFINFTPFDTVDRIVIE